MICPLMSKPVPVNDPYNNILHETLFVDCEKETCALWVGIRCLEGNRSCGDEYGCSIAMNVRTNASGFIEA